MESEPIQPSGAELLSCLSQTRQIRFPSIRIGLEACYLLSEIELSVSMLCEMDSINGHMRNIYEQSTLFDVKIGLEAVLRQCQDIDNTFANMLHTTKDFVNCYEVIGGYFKFP